MLETYSNSILYNLAVFFSKDLFIPVVLVFVSVIGICFFSTSLISILINFEMLFLGLNLLFVYSAFILDDFIGVLFSFFMLTILGAESSIGLALFILYYRLTGHISVQTLVFLKG
jgi:NADH-quinone oxidoreductase subunit K